MNKPVENAEIDSQRHDPYLQVIVDHTDSVGNTMVRMILTSRQVVRSSSEDDVPAAREAISDVETASRAFLTSLGRASCPEYLKGADAQLHEALKLLIHAGQLGAAGLHAMDATRLASIAREMDAAADDIAGAAQRITDWRTGAARF